MKNFKRILSLVLVAAMLFSFAGMTGYSPASIEAEAKHFKTAGGVEITMWSTIYKINHDYTMTYPDKTNTSVSHTSEVGDYAIPHFDEANNLGYKLVFPEGTTQFDAGCSIDGVYWTSYGTLTSTANSSYWSTGKAVMNRTGNDAMYWDYGALYRDNLLGKGVKGFRDIGKIKWRVVYTCNGTEYTEYWTVDVLDWDRQSAGNSQIWNGAATSSKPTDSHAGKNALTNLQVPATIYRNGTSVVQTMNNRYNQARRFDTFVMFTVPSGAYDVVMYQVDANDNKIANQITWSKPDGTSAAAQGTSANAAISGNSYKWSLGGSIAADAVAAYYHIEYKVDVTNFNGEPDTVTYIQYAASYVKDLQNHNAVWAIKMRNDGNGRNEAQSLFNFLHEMGFLPALVVNGVDVVVSASGITANYNGSWTWNSYYSESDRNPFSYSGSYAVGFDQTPKFDVNKSGAYWTGGVNGSTATSNSLGATIYYDSDSRAKTSAAGTDFTRTTVSSASIGMDMYLIHAKGGKNSGGGIYKWAYTDGYCETWTSSTSGWTYTTSDQDLGNGWNNKLTSVYSGASFTGYSQGIDPDDGLDGGTLEPTQTSYYNYTLNTLSSIPNLRCSVHTSCESKNSYFVSHFYMYAAYGWHIDFVGVDRSSPHDFIDAAITQNYVKAEMDSTWWNTYRNSVFAAYVNCGNLTAAETTSFSTNFSQPVYKFADYSALNTSILTPVEWDRGGKVGSGTEPAAGYLDWGTGYEKWNSKTYATSYGKVPGSLAAYDLVFTEDTEAETMEFKVSSTPRTGAYYYTAATWNAYTAARDYAVEVYNYPNSTVATFDYDTAYPAKAATEGGNQTNVGLACYHQAEIDAAVSNLQTKRAALVKYDVNNNNYDIDQYYRKLVNQLGTIAYDNSAKALFDFNTKHGFEGITSEIYDEATIVFRASAPDDVFDYVWTAAESSDPDYLGDGHVKVDEDGNPLALDANGNEVLASSVGDVGILEFPRADGTLRPVGRGNTFSQLYFDNSAASQYAVTSARAVLRNRLRWYMGGGGAAGYEYLGMVEGVYNQQGLTEDNLNNNPTQYFWTGKEHQDDILREVYALYRVKTTLRLAANYKQVVEALNNENNYIPSYDIGGTTYKAKNLQNVTMFQTYTPASAWDTVSITANGATYNTSGKTWYTEDSWAGFVADRNKLAAMIYNGSTRTSTNSPYGDNSEIGKDYIYDSGVANKYYTYDVKLSSGVSITNTYYTNGYYQSGGNLAAEYQDDINQAVKNYKAWFNNDTTDGKELVLKTLDDYNWTAQNTTTVSAIEKKVKELYNNVLNATHTVYDFKSAVDANGAITVELDKTAQAQKYAPADIAELEALAAVITALHKGGAEGTKFNGGMDLGSNAESFDNALKAFNNKYNAIVNGPAYVTKGNWNEIFAHVAQLAGASSVSASDIGSKFLKFYNVDSSVESEINDAEDSAYQDYQAATTQDEVNAAVERLYNALNRAFTSKEVGTTATTVKAYPATQTFSVYNYEKGGSKTTHIDVCQFTADSVDELTSAANAAAAVEYNMLTTTAQTLTAAATAVNNMKNLTTDSPAGKLVYTTVDTTYLDKAIAYANGELYTTDAEGNTVQKFTTVTNPAGTASTNVNTYTAESIEQLVYVLGEAAALDRTLGFSNQLAIDKITFALYEETSDDTPYLLADAIGSDVAFAYRDWATSNDIVWTSSKWEGYLYGERSSAYMGSSGYGLQYGPAYYGYLDTEIITPYTNAEGNRIDNGTVWDENGNLMTKEITITNEDGTTSVSTVEVGSTVFTAETWGAYSSAIKSAKELSRNLTTKETDQAQVDKAAKAIYDARAALAPSTYASNKTDFEETKKWYNEQLAAYVNATTAITRYEVNADGTPESHVEGNISLYTFPNDDVRVELLAKIEAFRANYADDNTTKPYYSIKQATDDKAEIDNIITENGIALKKTDDPSFRVGAEDLVKNFIAGTPDFVNALIAGGVYTAGSYDSDLIAKTADDWGVIGKDENDNDIYGWKTGSQGKEIDNNLQEIYGNFKSTENVDSNFGTILADDTDKLYNYVLDTRAKNLQFAVHMRDNELYNMLTSQFFVGNESFGKDLSFYYGTENAGYDDIYGSYTLKEYVFDQERVYDDIILLVDDFFATDDSWPLIYQVNGMTYSTSDEWGQQIACSIDGYEFIDGSYQYTGEGTAPASEKIIDILDEVGSHSGYYSTAFKAANINSYATDHYAWINDENGIFYTDTTSGIKYILASANNADACPKAYDVSVESGHWYTDGKGKLINGNRYYVFENNADITGSAHKSWFENSSYETLTNNLSDSYILGFFNTNYVDITTTDLAGADIGKLNNPDNPAEGASALYFINDIKENGWSPMSQEFFITFVNTEQGIIDQLVANQYVDIQNLKLLPAYDAYREVVELYHNVYYGQTVKYAAGSTNVIPGTNDTITEIENAVFYRYDNDEGKSDIALLEENYDRIGVVYGNDTITGSPYLRGTTKALPDAYYIKNDDASNNLVTFYSNDKDNTSFAYSAIYSPVTIDRADEVNGNYTNDNKSFKAQFIDLFVELNIVELKFDKLDELVNAFFNNYTDENGITYGLGKDNQTFKTNHGLEGKFYTYDMYTPESLQAVLQVLHEIKVDGVDSYISIISNDLYKAASDDTYVYSTVYDRETYGGSIYDEAKTQPVVDAAHAKLAEALSTLLVLKPAEMDELDEIVAKSDIAVENDSLYSKTATDSEGNNYWEVFEAALAEAKKYYKEDGTYKDGLTFAEDQADINLAEYNLSVAYANLKKVGDKTAPEMTIGTSAADMKIFYTQDVVDMDDSVATVDDAPATGTYILPVVGGQSLRVYTNELNPRIVIQLQDIASETVLYSKPERMSIAATKTSGAVSNVITGTETNGTITDVMKNTLSADKVNFETAAKADGTYDDNSSIFAILSPTFQAGGAQRQAVQYTITANDSAEDQKNIDGEKPQNNNVTELTFNNGASVALGAESSNGITVYIYYMNNMAEDGSDEGITSTGAVAKTAWKTDASVVLSANEVLGASKWINTYYLQRKYNSTVKSWDFVDANKDGCVNYVEGSESNVNGPVYNDPDFGLTNTGSFAYVLDETADAEVINTYTSNKKTTDTMDYAAATLAKEKMLDSVTAEKFAEMKASGRFTKYGAYDNWTQMFKQCSNGDLIFVHVLDRWGNVVNRIIEVTKYDNGISVSSSGAGEATVTEKDGSGLASISIWNYLDNNSTNVEYADGVAVEENNKVSVSAGVGDESGLEIVSVSDNVFTVAGLRAGIGYRIGAADNAGNVAYINVRTDSEGKFTFTVDTASEKVDTGEDTSVTENAVTFMLNNTAVITLNTGIGSSIVDAELEGNVFAGKKITHYITTEAGVTQLKVVNLADNTEEIFTSEKTKVTTNDDGTLKWATKRTLTEGEHNFRVYAMTDGEYESVGVKFTINATTKAVPLTFSVIGVGRTVLEFSGSAPAINSTYRSTTVPYGAKVKIVAQETKENCNFYYWQNDDTDRIVTTANTIEYTAVTAVDYNALFTNSASINSGMKLVIYVNNAKNVIKTFELYEGDDYIIPVGPSLPDYTFKGWSMSKAEVLASEKDTVIVEPVYVLTAENTVTITEGDYTTSGAGNYTATETERALATISASATNGAGEEFLYWFDEGTKDIVSYDRTYSFICIKDIVLTPVYGDASTINAQPVVRISNVVFDGSSNKVNFYAERSVGAGYTLLQTGIVVTKTAAIAENADAFVVDGASTATGVSNQTTNYGSYSASVKLSAEETVWARAYAICETDDGEIIEVYSDAVSYTNS